MGRIEEIKANIAEADKMRDELGPLADSDEIYLGEIKYLLSKLEIAQKALEAAKEQLDHDDHVRFDGDSWIKYIETTEGYMKVTEALQQIRE